MTFLLLGGLLAARLVFGYAPPATPLSLAAISDLLLIALAWVVGRAMPPAVARYYKLGAVLGLIGWEVREAWLIDPHGGLILLALALPATALHWQVRRGEDPALGWPAHGLFLVVVPWLTLRLLAGMEAPWRGGLPSYWPLTSTAGLINAIVIAALFLSAVALRHSPHLESLAQPKLIYRLCGHLALLGWIGHEWFLQPGLHDLALAAWAGYALFLALAGRRVGAEAQGLSHAIFACLPAAVLGYLITVQAAGWPLLNRPALAVAAVLVMAGIVAARQGDVAVVWIYRVAIHCGVLGLLWHEWAGLESGMGWVTVAWAIYTLGILAVGLRRVDVGLIYGAVATLVLVVGKLILIDLNNDVLTIWRSLLFLGFGLGFLILSYYLQSWLRRTEAKPR
jgi:hypothetical protein